MTIYFIQPISHGGDCLNTVPPQPCHCPTRPQVLYPGVFNIRNIWGFGFAQAIWAAQIGGFDLMVLTENNITDQAYFCNRLG